MRLRQVALVARDLDAAERSITAELGVELCFRDPGVAEFGLRNALFPIGEGLLEVVSPAQDGTTAGRLLERRGGDGGYMVLLQVDDLDEVRRRVEEHDVRIVFVAQAPGITGLHLHPRDLGGAIVSLDQSDDWAEWPWAGPHWRDHIRTEVVTGIMAVEIQAEEPATMAERWSAVLGLSAANVDGDPTITLDEGAVRFVRAEDGRGEGVRGVDLAAAPGTADRTIELVGTVVNVCAPT